MKFYKPNEAAVEWYETKYDNCIVRATGKEYRKQAGSGRAEVITRFVADGKTIGQISREAAESGFDPNFVVDSIFKHTNAPVAAFSVEAPEGTTLEEIRKIRKERRVSLEVVSKREAAAAAKAAKIAEREAAKAEREAAAAAKQAEREAKAAEREAAKAEKERLKAEAKAQREAERAAAPKAKGKRKKAEGEGSADGAGEAAAA